MKIRAIKISTAILVLFTALFGMYWVVQNELLNQQTNIGFTTFGTNGIAFDMALDGDTLYVSTKAGVYRFNTTSQQNEGLIKDLDAVSYAKAIVLDDDGKMWIGHDKGLTVYEPRTQKARLIDESSGLPDNRVNALCKDEQGCIWVGTWSGAVCINNRAGEVLNQDTGLMVDMVNEIHSDGMGGLWFGSAVSPQGGLCSFYHGRWDYYNVENGLPHNSVNDIYSLSDSQVLVGTGFYDKGGLSCFSFMNDRWILEKNFSITDGVLDGKIRSIYRDDSGILWVGYESQGISLIKEGESILLTTVEGLPHNEVMKVLQDGQGNYWLATAGGVACIEKEKLLAYIDRNME